MKNVIFLLTLTLSIFANALDQKTIDKQKAANRAGFTKACVAGATSYKSVCDAWARARVRKAAVDQCYDKVKADTLACPVAPEDRIFQWLLRTNYYDLKAKKGLEMNRIKCGRYDSNHCYDNNSALVEKIEQKYSDLEQKFYLDLLKIYPEQDPESQE